MYRATDLAVYPQPEQGDSAAHQRPPNSFAKAGRLAQEKFRLAMTMTKAMALPRQIRPGNQFVAEVGNSRLVPKGTDETWTTSGYFVARFVLFC